MSNKKFKIGDEVFYITISNNQSVYFSIQRIIIDGFVESERTNDCDLYHGKGEKISSWTESKELLNKEELKTRFGNWIK